ncbi:MAG: glycosyltransferase family 4 protein [Lachnospiraceae bacterium]|nr:glycosyltransferase family 4 protein [Lachnospiraceae bacterium]
MKVLILSNYANGLYLFRKELLCALLEKGYEVLVSVPQDENCVKIENLGCRLIPVKLERRGNNPIRDYALFKTYRKLLDKERPAVVLTYTIKPNLYGGLACRMKATPYLVNITGLGTALENPGMLGRILLHFYKISTKRANCVFFQNDGNRQFMQERGIATENSRLLPGSGVNLKEHPAAPYPTEDKGIIFLAVLRIMKDKGIEEYLAAAERIKREYPDTHFYLVGEYEEETRELYEPLILKLSDMGIIRYFGHIDNVPKVMAESHVIVHPSYHEGLSNVLLEAAAAARPVLASDIPGCRETLMPGLSGILFQPKDTESLVQAIKTILSYSETDRREMGQQGREYVEAVFDRKKVTAAYLEEISKILS